MLEKLKKVNWLDVAKRAGKTFGQAFIASISVDSLLTIRDADTAKTVLTAVAVAGISAGISAVWNMAIGMLESEGEEDE